MGKYVLNLSLVLAQLMTETVLTAVEVVLESLEYHNWTDLELDEVATVTQR